MHSVNDPAEEARSLYVEQSRLVERLTEPGSTPLVVWDVGLGAAANAMAAIHAVEALRTQAAADFVAVGRPLTLVSFENDLDSLVLALRHPAWFTHLRHAAPRGLLAENSWVNTAAGIEWLLLRGDFKQSKFTAPLPDIIFFDPFSFKADSALWTWGLFANWLRFIFRQGGGIVHLFLFHQRPCGVAGGGLLRGQGPRYGSQGGNDHRPVAARGGPAA